MYDLTVEDVHTFAVGEGDWVVHNCISQARRNTGRDLVRLAQDAFSDATSMNGGTMPNIVIAASYDTSGNVVYTIGQESKDTIQYWMRRLRNERGYNVVVPSNFNSIQSGGGRIHAEQLMYQYLNQAEPLDIGVNTPDGACSDFCIPFFMNKDVAVHYRTTPLDYWYRYKGQRIANDR